MCGGHNQKSSKIENKTIAPQITIRISINRAQPNIDVIVFRVRFISYEKVCTRILRFFFGILVILKFESIISYKLFKIFTINPIPRA